MAVTFHSRTLDKFVVRLPDGMRDRIAEAAEANNRSMNAEIVARLEASFEAPRALAPNTAEEDMVWENKYQLDQLRADMNRLSAEILQRLEKLEAGR